MTTKTIKDIVTHEPQPIFVSLRDRLNAGRDAAEAAWAGKASAGFRDTVITLGNIVRSFDVRAPEIQNEEDLLRMRAELAETLRSAAAAIAPRAA
ncbi:hypothetical protein [Beijerinckia sp. L45]|uniref:hypothetical protein n=1 Tax=Beijerinckia sp. L45 TaxID=1641855 RepID=UPI00131B2B00|nr:hypothetical protein [Beijerinckia sp. L45]